MPEVLVPGPRSEGPAWLSGPDDVDRIVHKGDWVAAAFDGATHFAQVVPGPVQFPTACGLTTPFGTPMDGTVDCPACLMLQAVNAERAA